MTCSSWIARLKSTNVQKRTSIRAAMSNSTAAWPDSAAEIFLPTGPGVQRVSCATPGLVRLAGGKARF